MNGTQAHPEQLRQELTAAAPAAPWVTYHDLQTGGRVELSRATFANWVAKAAGLLEEEYDVATGDRVVVKLDLHWLLPVWCFAVWSLGASVATEPSASERDIVITDQPEPDMRGTVNLASPTDLWGTPLGDGTPVGTEDAVGLLRGYPDERFGSVPEPQSVALHSPLESWTGAQALEQAATYTPAEARRPLVHGHPTGLRALVAATLAGPVRHGSSVLVRTAPEQAPGVGHEGGRTEGAAGASPWLSVAEQERVDALIDLAGTAMSDPIATDI